jgi:hypothetical protein
MPNRYEREIEEILRNLEQPEAKPGAGQKFGGRPRRKASPRPSTRQQYPSVRLSMSEWFLLIGVVTALVAGGYAFARYTYTSGQMWADLISGILAVISLICIIIVALSQFLQTSRRSPSMRAGVTVTPLRRSPLSILKTRWNLFILKLRYRRKNE